MRCLHMYRNASGPTTRNMLEKAADDLLKNIPDHQALTDLQMKRRARQARECLQKYVCQNDPTLDAMNYLRHRELMLVIQRAHLDAKQKKMVMLLLQDMSVQQAGEQLGLKRSCAYMLYRQVVDRLRVVWKDAPVTGLASSYCRDINRRYAKKIRFGNYSRENHESDFE